MREKRFGQNYCELILDQSLPADHEYASGVGVDTSFGEVSNREINDIVPALLELYVKIRRIFQRGMGPYLPGVRRNCPPLVGEPLSPS